MDDISFPAFLAVALIVGFFGGFTAGCVQGQKNQRSEAIEAGVAEWRADPKTGSTTFAYKKKAEME